MLRMQQSSGHYTNEAKACSLRGTHREVSMPRHLALRAINTTLPAASAQLVGAAAAFLAVCALALVLCASHSAPERLRRALASVSRRRADPVIAAVHQVQPGEGVASPSVWQKGILMGGKCQLPDFSGVINYDPAGNLVAPARPGRAVPALGW
ncbi:uncharacterized protein LOC133918612 [Phragmites australis]|uniref:uncharacterized protein LOC133918612 n=1 Tax=Phragmites australis TaxID=29695 RepID=UPI002D78597C|nr:uncharacterized protein LOC133918612 [Phragmites australis]